MHRWQQIERLFHAAVSLPPKERQNFLQEACARDLELYCNVMDLASCDRSEDDSWAPAAAARLIVGSQTLAAGDRLGPYEITSFLAAGGMGVVYRARDLRMHRDVAIKVCSDGLDWRFWREARAAAQLNHSNVCQIHDVGPNYLVMELVDGSTLAEILRGGPLPPARVLALARQIADALEAAHRQDVIHCDLKPGNIKITTDDTVKVLDFGLARQLRRKPDDHFDPSHDEAVPFGTTSYLSPELIKDFEIDERTDVFCFGLVLYEMLRDTPRFWRTRHRQPATQFSPRSRRRSRAIRRLRRSCGVV